MGGSKSRKRTQLSLLELQLIQSRSQFRQYKQNISFWLSKIFFQADQYLIEYIIKLTIQHLPHLYLCQSLKFDLKSENWHYQLLTRLRADHYFIYYGGTFYNYNSEKNFQFVNLERFLTQLLLYIHKNDLKYPPIYNPIKNNKNCLPRCWTCDRTLDPMHMYVGNYYLCQSCYDNLKFCWWCQGSNQDFDYSGCLSKLCSSDCPLKICQKY